MHDFRAKLSDPRALPAVEEYLRRARRRRQAEGSRAPLADSLHSPLSINLDLTLACDYRCGHCIDGALLNGGRQIEFDVVARSIELLAGRGLRSVILIGGGEPTLHPRFEDVVRLIKSLHLECAVVSNGAHNGRIAAVAHLLGGADWIRLSLDAGTDETFQALHRPRRAITLGRICETAAMLKRQAPRVQLGFAFVVMWDAPRQALRPAAVNVPEMAQAAALAKAHGFDYISFKPMLVRDGAGAEVVNIGARDLPAAPQPLIEQIREGLLLAQAHADARFRVVPSTNLLALLDGSAWTLSALQPRECHLQQFRQVLTPNGLFACPAHRGNAGSLIAGPHAYSQPEHFEAAARGSERQIAGFNAAVECRSVTCIYNQVNWWLEDLIASGQSIAPWPAPDLFL